MPQQNSMIYITDTDYYILNSGGGYDTIVGNGDIYITDNDYYLVLHGSEPSDNLIEGLIYRRHDGEPYTNEVDYYLNLQNLPLLNMLVTAGYNLTPDFYFYDNFEYLKKSNYRTDTDYYFYNKEHHLFKTDYRTDTDYYLIKGGSEIGDNLLNGMSYVIRTNYNYDKNHYLNKTGGLEYKNLTLTQFLKDPFNHIYIPLVATGMFPFKSLPPYIKTMLKLPMFKLADYYLWGNLIVQFSKNLKVTNKLEYNVDYSLILYRLRLSELKPRGKDFYIINGNASLRPPNLTPLDHREYKKDTDYYSEVDYDNFDLYLTFLNTKKIGGILAKQIPLAANLKEDRLTYLSTNSVDISENSNEVYSKQILKRYNDFYFKKTIDRNFLRHGDRSYYSNVHGNSMILKYNYDLNDRVDYSYYTANHIKSLMTGILHLKVPEENNLANKIKDDSMSSDYMKEYNLIKFYIEDVYNNKFITMPAYLLSLADLGGNAKILTINYVNGIYPKFLYTGVLARKINFSFKLVCTSRALLKNYAQKMNYLRSLTYPSFNKSNTNIKFPIAPIVKLTIGDIVCDVYGMFLSVIPKWDMNNTPWNIDSFDFTMGSDGTSFTAEPGVRSMQIPYIATIDCSFLMMHYPGQEIGGSHYNLPENWLRYKNLRWEYNNGPGTEFPPSKPNIPQQYDERNDIT